MLFSVSKYTFENGSCHLVYTRRAESGDYNDDNAQTASCHALSAFQSQRSHTPLLQVTPCIPADVAGYFRLSQVITGRRTRPQCQRTRPDPSSLNS